jgi:hypothetical protein
MGQPIQWLTPDRSRIRPKSRPACRRHPSTRAVGAGAPPRLGKGHPSSAPRRSDPPLTELAALSPRGRVRVYPHPSLKSVDVKCPQWVDSGPSPGPARATRLRRKRPFPTRGKKRIRACFSIHLDAGLRFVRPPHARERNSMALSDIAHSLGDEGYQNVAASIGLHVLS